VSAVQIAVGLYVFKGNVSLVANRPDCGLKNVKWKINIKLPLIDEHF
jgi:hypothetical protein